MVQLIYTSDDSWQKVTLLEFQIAWFIIWILDACMEVKYNSYHSREQMMKLFMVNIMQACRWEVSVQNSIIEELTELSSRLRIFESTCY